GYVECGPCTGKKQKAIKSCLECLDSYCPVHFEIHEELHSGQHHKLTNATGFLQDKICSRHGKLLEVFCCLDQQCVCLMCTMDDHIGHRIVSALAERTEKQSQISGPKMKSQQRILDRKRELGELQKAVDSHKQSAKAALEECKKTFTEIICFIKKKQSEVLDLIQTQEKIAVSQAEHLLKQMEEEIAELQRQDEELQQLSLTEDHIHFLQQGGGGVLVWAGIIKDELVGPFRVEDGVKLNSQSYCQFLEDTFFKQWYRKKSASFKKNMIFMQDNAPSHTSKYSTAWLARKGIKEENLMIWPPCSPDLNPIENLWSIIKCAIYKEGKQYTSLNSVWEAVVAAARNVDGEQIKTPTESMDGRLLSVLAKKETYTHKKFFFHLIEISYHSNKNHVSSSDYCELTMDPNTAYRRLDLSEGNRAVSNQDRDLPHPDHPERFDWPQVLCEQPVCGRFYWEVEWSGGNGVNIAVSYKSIRRKGGHNECWFGCSEQSWRLYCSPFRYAFRHHGKETYIPKTNNSTRIGVYVDYNAGALSFYSIAGKMILLYKVQCEFTEPLYPGFTV
ncbi:tripartite motif-containing protein 16, partial [Silurus asotus]